MTYTSGNLLGIESAGLLLFVSSYLLAGKCAGQDIQEQQNTDADAQATIQGRVVAAATEADDADTAALLHFAGENTCHQQYPASAALSFTTCHQPVAASTRCGNDSLRQATNPIGLFPHLQEQCAYQKDFVIASRRSAYAVMCCRASCKICGLHVLWHNCNPTLHAYTAQLDLAMHTALADAP